MPDCWADVEAFAAELKEIPWLKPQGDPDPAWSMYGTEQQAMVSVRHPAMDSAWHAAMSMARDAAKRAGMASAQDAAKRAAFDATTEVVSGVGLDPLMGAGWDAALWAVILICKGLDIDQSHVNHAKERMDVWRRGYGLLCDVDRKLLVYRRVS